jgi:hypothetical protein
LTQVRSHLTRSRQALLLLLGFAGIVAVAWYRGHIADYRREVEPELNALARGDFWGAVEHQANIGPFSVVLRAPLVSVAHAFGAGELLSYRIGVIACLAAAALLGFELVRWSRETVQPRVVKPLIILLAVTTPAATEALNLGHPEEILAASLMVGGIVACLRSRYAWGAILLGCAVATKQWAFLAIGPALLAAGRGFWWRVVPAACGLATLFSLPLVLADHGRFEAAAREAASAPTRPMFQDWWYLLHRELPYDFAQHTKPMIVLAAIPLTLFALWRGGGGSRALPLLALLLVLRCVLDPQTQYYYHLPLILTLLAWDVQTRRRLPYATLVTAGALLVTNTYIAEYGHLYTASVAYFIWTLALVIFLVMAIIRGAGIPRALEVIGLAHEPLGQRPQIAAGSS